MNFKNFDLDNIFTPVKPDALESLLKQTNYDKEKTEFLVNGFKNGFDLGYRGPSNIQQKAPNLKFTIGNKLELWNKVMKEVQANRYAGPFEDIPFENFIQSPIGLVPKDGGTKTRLIFHLSYPRNPKKGFSVNASTPTELTSVKYPSFDDAVRLCIKCGLKCKVAKSDMSSAFRHFGINKKFWKFLVMKAFHPETNKVYYFIDKCMPFGAAISCAIFQCFSDAVAHVVTYLTKRDNINYLDDFFFAALQTSNCNQQVECFLQVCDRINFPVSMEKTFWATTRIVFLDLLIDTVLQMIFIPIAKVERALELVRRLKDKKKTKLKTLQKLAGFLNFLGKSIVPGRAFTRRLYAHMPGELKPHHHLKITKEIKLDLEMWENFLQHPSVFSRKFIDLDASKTSREIDFYTDASANSQLGCGGYNQNSWFIIQWDEEFIKDKNPSINYLELYAVTVGIFLWIHRYKDSQITLFCDNMSVVQMINNNSSKCKNCMVLIRIIVLQGLTHNVKINAKHVLGKLNTFSDMLSRLKYKEFRSEARKQKKSFNQKPDDIPGNLWPMNDIWLQN